MVQVISNMYRFALFLLVSLLGLSVQAGNWPRFRGPNGSGRSSEALTLNSGTAPVLWKTPLPASGHGSPVVWNDRVFVLAGDEETGDRLPTAVDATQGRLLWSHRHPAGRHAHHKQNTFASSTPAVDETHVYFAWGTPEKLTLVAYTHEGRQAWEADLGPVVGGHGFGASPVIWNDLLLLNNDQDGTSSLLGIDKATGKVRWSLPRQSKRLTYSTPCIRQAPDGTEEAIFTNWQHGITAVDPKTGTVRWENDVFGKPSAERAIGSPVLAGELVIGTCGFVTKRKHVVALRPVPGASRAEEVWRIEKAVPHIPTPLVVGDFLYLWNEQGILTCADPRTGAIHFNERVGGEGYSSPVSAGDRVYRIAKNGDISVIAIQDSLEVLATIPLGEECFATPALSGSRMFVRTSQHLLALGK